MSDDDLGAVNGRERCVARALRAITPARFFCGARALSDPPLHSGESSLYQNVDPKVRRATATGRELARELLSQFGVKTTAILRGAGGAPAWPAGIQGSLAHDADFAVCIMGIGPNAHVGVDVEPAHALPSEIVDTVLVNAAEREAAGDDAITARLLFCAKEAVYKICYPVENIFYEFSDILLLRRKHEQGQLTTVGPVKLVFRTSTGRQSTVVAVREPRLLAVATADWIEPPYTR